MKYNLSSIMRSAWKFFHKGVESFAQALRMAWANEKSQLAAKSDAGVTEEVHTWAGWKAKGFEVRHESKALYQAVISDPRTRSGQRTVSYFGLSQVQPIAQ